MSMNLIAILISLAMMLTGAGAEGQPAEASRMLKLHDISLTVNGERVYFDPVVRLGASTDGQSALFEFGVDADGATLLPIQLASDENGLTALFEKSDVAVNVTAQALESATQLLTEQAASAAEGEDSALMNSLTQDYFPAYIGLLEAMGDEAFLEEFQAQAQAVVDSIVDRGEGKPVTEEVEGKMVELTEYHYTVDSAKMAELSDAVLTCNDTVKAYYDAMFSMFKNMPEETGFSGFTSYADMFEKTGMQMSMEMDEKRSDDGGIELVDAVLTMDMSAMIAKVAEGQDAGEAPEISPMVMNIHSTAVGKKQQMNMEMTYAVEGVEMEMSMRATQGDDSMMADVAMFLYQGKEQLGSMHMNIGKGSAGATGNAFTHANLDLDAGEDARFEFSFLGSATPEGAAEGDFDIGFKTEGNAFELAFIAEIAPDPIENHVTGHTADVVIDDLSEEGLSAISQDQAVVQALTKISGTVFADVQKLASNEGVQSLMALLSATGEPAVETETTEAPAEGETADTESETADTEGETADAEGEDGGEYEIELTQDENGDFVIDLGDLEIADGDDTGMDDYSDYEEIEDDGVLGFNLPEITWLPDGWTVGAQSQDTAYDWADFNIKDDKGNESMYALFFADEDDSQSSYIVADDGAVSPVSGREISVTDFGDEGMSVSWHDKGLFVNLVFYNNAVDVDTIGKIVAGIQF